MENTREFLPRFLSCMRLVTEPDIVCVCGGGGLNASGGAQPNIWGSGPPKGI